MKQLINQIAAQIVKWAVMRISNHPRQHVLRICKDHHFALIRGETVYVVGKTDDSLLVRCWFPKLQVEINLNPASFE